MNTQGVNVFEIIKSTAGFKPVLTLAFALVVIGSNNVAQATEKYHFDIQMEEIGAALNAFAVQTDSEILFTTDIVKDKQTQGLEGEYTSEEALERLLDGTGLKAEEAEEKVFLIHEASAAGVLGLAAGIQSEGVVATGDSKKKLNEGPETWMEELIVTAGKRSESIQDTAMSITALSHEDIERKGLVSMEDYLSTVPGVNQIDYGAGINQILIRGIGFSAFEQSTVSTYFGEIPLTNSARYSSTDLKLVDIGRIEVLRGPQGTLYGSGAMGGTIRNIPVAPNLDQFEAKVDVGYANTAHSNDNSGKVVGVINIPVIQDQLALRVAAYRYDKAGYVDLVSDAAIEARAVATGSTVAIKEDVGGHTYTGGRASLLWQPTDNLGITLMQIDQELEEDGRNELLLTKGGYQATSLATGKEFKFEDFDVTNLVVEYDLGWATIIASSTRFDGKLADGIDLGRIIPFASYSFVPQESKEAFIQEVRLVSHFQGPLQFIGGVYYENVETVRNAFTVWTGDLTLMPAFLGSDPTYFAGTFEWHIQQSAIFGELSYWINDQWKFTLGGRWFDYDRRDITSFVNAGSLTESDLPTEEKDINPKIGINFTPNDNVLVYAQWAQGYRLGKGIATPPASTCDTDGDGLLDFTSAPLDPGPLASDITENTELGGKFSLLDNRLAVNAALYRIIWDEIAITVGDTSPLCAGSVQLNGGKARSQGIELETSYYLTSNLQLTLSASYVDAEFLTDNVSSNNTKGDRLPLSPRVNGNLAIQYEFDLGGLHSFARVDYGHVGSYLSNAAGNVSDSGGYSKLNMRLGIAFDRLNIEIYGNNLTNKDQQTIYFFGARGWRLPPRTVGLDIGYQF